MLRRLLLKTTVFFFLLIFIVVVAIFHRKYDIHNCVVVALYPSLSLTLFLPFKSIYSRVVWLLCRSTTVGGVIAKCVIYSLYVFLFQFHLVLSYADV